MSKIIEIIEENNELKLASENAKIVCGNSNYKLKFLLSEDWRKVNHKAVVFCVCGKKVTQTMVYDECEVPVMHGGGVLFVSLVAGDEDYQLATTDVKIELVENNQCPACKQHINGKTDFKNEISWKEYQISGLCQECQDAIFG